MQNLNELLAEILAAYVYYDGTNNTTQGAWCMYANELAEKFNLDEKFVLELADQIIYYLEKHEGVSDVEYYQQDNTYVFDVNYYLHYCGLDEDDF